MFGPGDPGSNPGCYGIQVKIWVKPKIQDYDRAMLIVIQSDWYQQIDIQGKRINGILHQYEIANCRQSMDCSHSSTSLFKSSRLVLQLTSLDDVILAGSEICKNGRGPSKY